MSTGARGGVVRELRPDGRTPDIGVPVGRPPRLPTPVSSSCYGCHVTLTGTTLPAGGHFMIGGPAYALTTPDVEAPYLSSGSEGVKVVDPSGLTTDAVGYAGAPAGYFAGTGLTAPANSSTEYAFVRDERAGKPVDTGSDAADFTLVSTDPSGLPGAVLGAPGTQTASSPTRDNSALRSTLFDPTARAGAAPNRTYTPGDPGTMIVRRTITNLAAVPVKTLQIRITSLSTIGVPGSHAILRWTDSTTGTVSGATVQGLTLGSSPAQPDGGGLGSTARLTPGAGLPAGGLAPGASVSVAFQFAVDQGGSFWFGYDLDATG